MVTLTSLFTSFHPTESPHIPWNSMPARLWKDRYTAGLQCYSTGPHVILSKSPHFPLRPADYPLRNVVGVSQGGRGFPPLHHQVVGEGGEGGGAKSASGLAFSGLIPPRSIQM